MKSSSILNLIPKLFTGNLIVTTIFGEGFDNYGDIYSTCLFSSLNNNKEEVESV